MNKIFLVTAFFTLTSTSSFAKGITNLCNANEEVVISCQNGESVKIDVCEEAGPVGKLAKENLAILSKSDGNVVTKKITSTVMLDREGRLIFKSFTNPASYIFILENMGDKAHLEIDNSETVNLTCSLIPN